MIYEALIFISIRCLPGANDWTITELSCAAGHFVASPGTITRSNNDRQALYLTELKGTSLQALACITSSVSHYILGWAPKCMVDRQALYLTELKGTSLQALACGSVSPLHTYFPCPRKLCPHKPTVFNQWDWYTIDPDLASKPLFTPGPRSWIWTLSLTVKLVYHRPWFSIWITLLYMIPGWTSISHAQDQWFPTDKLWICEIWEKISCQNHFRIRTLIFPSVQSLSESVHYHQCDIFSKKTKKIWPGNPLDLWSWGFPGPNTITRVFLFTQKPHSCGFIILTEENTRVWARFEP
jgi:hypothetical protein